MIWYMKYLKIHLQVKSTKLTLLFYENSLMQKEINVFKNLSVLMTGA